MKLVSWNVNGLRSCLQKGFADSMRALDADVICLQETKMEPHQADIPLEGYEMVFNSAEKKGYSGTAVLTRAKPLAVSLGIGIEEHDHEGRVITLEFPDFYLVNCYTPNSQRELKRLTTACAGRRFPGLFGPVGRAKARRALRRSQCGAPGNRPQKPRHQPHERGFYRPGARKIFRPARARVHGQFPAFLSGSHGAYSWWSYMFSARKNNAGWRIDYFVVSNRLMPRAREAAIHSDILGSDHCPVSLVLADA